jgi:D-3-phosphoglycerate dehydrogenase / 2-oxoglutarate reductase
VRPRLLIAEAAGFSPDALSRLRQFADVTTGDLSRDELIASVRDVDILWVRLRNRIDEQVMDAAPRLKIIVTNTTGINHVNVGEASLRGIRLLSLKGEAEFLRTVRATAELTMGLLLSLTRHIPAATAHVAGGGWDRYPFQGHDLYGRTAGIVGFGRLGRIVAEYLHAFGMRVLAATKDPDRAAPQQGVTLLPLEELLAEADVVTLHVNLDDSTRGMFGAREFSLMKPGAWFINTARGELVDEAALLQALTNGSLAGAALDVVANDLAGESRLPELRAYAALRGNLLLTPHIGGYTFESLDKTETFLAERLFHVVRETCSALAANT